MNGRARLGVLVAAVVAAGAAAATTGLLSAHDAPSWWRLGPAVAVVLLGDIAVLHVRFGHDRYSVTWSETALIVSLVLLPPAWIPAVAAVGIGAAHALARRSPVKVAFNAGSGAAGAALAALVYAATGGIAVDQPAEWGALGLAALVFYCWNQLTVAAAVAVSQDLPLRDVIARSARTSALVWAGNTAAGVVLVGVATSQPVLLCLVPFPFAVLTLAYRGYMTTIAERDLWQILERASRALLALEPDDVVPAVLEHARALFKAEVVEMVLVEPAENRTIVHRSMRAGMLECIELPGTQPPALPVPMAVVAPLVTQHAYLGMIRLGFRAPVKLPDRDLQVLHTFANHVGASLHNARLHRAVSEERAKLRGIVDYSSDGILSLGPDGHVTSWNPAMARITGVAEGSALGAPLFAVLDVSAEDGTPVTFPWLLDQLRGQDVADVSLALGRRRGSSRWLHLSASAVRRVGRLDGVVIVVRDVTAAREAAEAKQDFVASVSHELRTPLTPLKGFLLTLLRPDFHASDDEVRDFLGRMLGQAERLERLIEDLLGAARVDASEFVVHVEPVDVDEVVERVLRDFQRPVEHRRARPPVMAVADPLRLEQVIANLLSNADKYSPDGLVRVSVERRGEAVELRVRDQGPGIPEDQHQRVFERFTRLGNHLTRQPGGTGLGLYIARRLVEAMGGTIGVQSRPGEGATFIVSLPVVRVVAVPDDHVVSVAG